LFLSCAAAFLFWENTLYNWPLRKGSYSKQANIIVEFARVGNFGVRKTERQISRTSQEEIKVFCPRARPKFPRSFEANEKLISHYNHWRIHGRDADRLSHK
jgi:hypothetical protein